MNRVPDTRRQRHPHRAVFAVIAALAALGSLVAHADQPAAATANDEAAFVAALNQVRAANGLPAFSMNSELSTLSRGYAQVMADAGEIFHASPISAGYTGSWAKLGENVGVGANVSVLVDALVASPGHFANIIDPAFTQIGVGVVWKDSALCTTHRFLQLPGAPPTTTAPPAPTAPPVTAPPTPTSTTIPPLPAPAITEARVVVLLEMLHAIGT